MRNLGSAFIELFNKSSKFDKNKKVFLNGEDNLYPDRIESVTEHSVTAKRCSAIMASYIAGKGFGEDLNNLIINPRSGKTLLDMALAIGGSFSKQRGAFIQASYNIAGKNTSFAVLPFADCKLGKSDGDDYSGKILVCNDWSDAKEVKKAKYYDVYNPDPNVVQSQIKKAGGISKYKGQILFYNFDDYVYPVSNLHPAILDAESERLASVYKNKSLKKGFFGKTLVITKPLVNNFETDPDEKRRQEGERSSFRDTIQQFIGAENVDGVMHMELEFTGDEIEKEIIFKNIDSNIDDKLFAFTENSVADNIRMCFNNVPGILIKTQETAFGQNGSAMKEAKLFYQEQTEGERLVLEQVMNRLFGNYKTPLTDLKIIPLIKIENGPTDN